MLKCPKCGNQKTFVEVHVGGFREHQWEQQPNGRFEFVRSLYDKVDDHRFVCGECKMDVSNQYRKFLQALFQLYNEKEHGA